MKILQQLQAWAATGLVRVSELVSQMLDASKDFHQEHQESRALSAVKTLAKWAEWTKKKTQQLWLRLTAVYSLSMLAKYYNQQDIQHRQPQKNTDQGPRIGAIPAVPLMPATKTQHTVTQLRPTGASSTSKKRGRNKGP
jgi:hypothetical protein